MAKSGNQKTKLLHLQKILLERTDDDHGMTMPEIIDALAALDIKADRKTLYQDFEELRDFGLDIIMEKRGKQTYYHVGERPYELAELKLLVDSVQAAKFISEKKSQQLIKKLEGLVSREEAKELQRQVLITGRVKTMNESVYYNVDMIHNAIRLDREITFQYFQWNVDKEMQLRKNGATYRVSPWSLLWDDEYYYLAAFDEEAGIIKHYRVDKMLRIRIEESPRAGRDVFDRMDLSAYTKSLFGMFGGDPVKVRIEARNEMAGVLIDRFGKDIILSKTDDPDWFLTTVEVRVSRLFLGWIFALGDGVRIAGPDEVVKMARQEAARLLAQYA